MTFTFADKIIVSVMSGTFILSMTAVGFAVKFLLKKIETSKNINDKRMFDQIADLTVKIDNIFKYLAQYNKELYREFVRQCDFNLFKQDNREAHKDLRVNLDAFKDKVIDKIQVKNDSGN